MAEGECGAVLGASGLDRYHWLLRRQRLAGGGVELARVVDRLDVQADRGHPRIVDQGGDAVREPDAGLVTECHQMPDRQPAPLHRQVEADIAGLGEDGDAALAAPAAMLIEPEQSTVEIIDGTVAIGTEDRHVASSRDQGLLQLLAPAAGLPKAGCVADGTACSHGAELADDTDRELAVDGDEGCVRRLGQLRDAAIGPGPGRVHLPDRSRELHLGAAAGHPLGLPAAEHRDRARPEQAAQVQFRLRAS